MTVATQQVSVSTTAQVLDGATGAASVGVSLTLYNAGAVDCYLGASNVTSGNGFLLKAGASFATELHGGDAIYAITASGSTTVHTLKESGN